MLLELAAYACTSAFTAALWLAYSPLVSVCKDAYGWSEKDVAALAVWSPVVNILLAPGAPGFINGRLGGARGTTADPGGRRTSKQKSPTGATGNTTAHATAAASGALHRRPKLQGWCWLLLRRLARMGVRLWISLSHTMPAVV